MFNWRGVVIMKVKFIKLKKAFKAVVRRRKRDSISGEGCTAQNKTGNPELECKSVERQCFCQYKSRFVEDKYTLSTVPWYWPQISCDSATSAVKVCPDGTFLVRRSETSGYSFSLTYKVGGIVGNARVHCKNGLFGLCYDDKVQPREPTLKLLVEKLLTAKGNEQLIMVHRRGGDSTKFVPLKLEHPLQREISLMDHCRREIMRTVDRPEHVWQFDIPQNLRVFLLELNNME